MFHHNLRSLTTLNLNRRHFTPYEQKRHNFLKLLDCVLEVVKCLTVTIIVDTYLHIELNFRYQQNAQRLTMEERVETYLQTTLQSVLFEGNFISLRNGKDMICISTFSSRFFRFGAKM